MSMDITVYNENVFIIRPSNEYSIVFEFTGTTGDKQIKKNVGTLFSLESNNKLGTKILSSM